MAYNIPTSVEITYIKQDISDIKNLLIKINDRLENYGERISVIDNQVKNIELQVDENRKITFAAIGSSIFAILGIFGQFIWLAISKIINK